MITLDVIMIVLIVIIICGACWDDHKKQMAQKKQMISITPAYWEHVGMDFTDCKISTKVKPLIVNQKMLIEMAENTKKMMLEGDDRNALIAINALITELRDPIDLMNPSGEKENGS